MNCKHGWEFGEEHSNGEVRLASYNNNQISNNTVCCSTKWCPSLRIATDWAERWVNSTKVNTVVDNAKIVLENTATKHDSEKNPLELLPFEALEEIGKVLQFGAKKYDSHNWRKGFVWSRLIGAALRHIFAFARGEDKDPETGFSHLAHAGCCVLFLLSFTITNNGTDDRVKI